MSMILFSSICSEVDISIHHEMTQTQSSFPLHIHSAIRRSNDPTTKMPTTIRIASAKYGNRPVSADTQLSFAYNSTGPTSSPPMPTPNFSHAIAFATPSDNHTATCSGVCK